MIPSLILPASAFLLSKIIKSYRYKAVNDEFMREGNDPYIFALFHSVQMLVAAYRAPFKTNILVSLSPDGEIAADTLLRLGFGVVRGSSSRRGREALGELTELIKNGESVAITVDGPRGPREEVKNGVILLAMRTGVPVICVSASARPIYRFRRSWDNFVFAPPVANVNICFSKPVYINTDRDMEYYRGIIRDNLLSITEICNKIACER